MNWPSWSFLKNNVGALSLAARTVVAMACARCGTARLAGVRRTTAGVAVVASHNTPFALVPSLEDSRIPLHHWCYAFWRASTSKKGASALEIHRQIGLSQSSLFMLNCIRYAMSDSASMPLGPNGGDVEVDEAYIGGKPRHKGCNKRGCGTKKLSGPG